MDIFDAVMTVAMVGILISPFWLMYLETRLESVRIKCPVCTQKSEHEISMVKVDIERGIITKCKVCGAILTGRLSQTRPIRKLLDKKRKRDLYREKAVAFNEALGQDFDQPNSHKSRLTISSK